MVPFKEDKSVALKYASQHSESEQASLVVLVSVIAPVLLVLLIAQSGAFVQMDCSGDEGVPSVLDIHAVEGSNCIRQTIVNGSGGI